MGAPAGGDLPRLGTLPPGRSVRYYASPAATRAVARAVERVQARDVIEIHSLEETLKGESNVAKLARAVA